MRNQGSCRRNGSIKEEAVVHGGWAIILIVVSKCKDIAVHLHQSKARGGSVKSYFKTLEKDCQPLLKNIGIVFRIPSLSSRFPLRVYLHTILTL